MSLLVLPAALLKKIIITRENYQKKRKKKHYTFKSFPLISYVHKFKILFLNSKLLIFYIYISILKL